MIIVIAARVGTQDLENIEDSSDLPAQVLKGMDMSHAHVHVSCSCSIMSMLRTSMLMSNADTHTHAHAMSCQKKHGMACRTLILPLLEYIFTRTY